MTSDELGDIKREFKPGLENLIAGIIIGVLLIAAGCAALSFATKGVIESGGTLPFWEDKVRKGWSWTAALLAIALGVGFVIGGVLLIRWVRSLFSFRLHVRQNGMAVFDKRATRIISWDDILSVQETHLFERPPILKGAAKYALPKTMSKSYIVSVTEGEPVSIDGNTIKMHVKLAEMIKVQTERRNIPWQIVELQGY